MEIHKYAHTENFFFLLTQLIKDIQSGLTVIATNLCMLLSH